MDQAALPRTHIRWMIRADLQSVMTIERASFDYPWREEDFVDCLHQRNNIGMVAEHDKAVVGYVLYELHKDRLHVLNLAVDPIFRRRGVARAIVAKLAGKLSRNRRRRIVLEVSERNVVAQLALKQLGFRAVSVLRDFYDDTDDDAIQMQRSFRPPDLTVPINRIAGMLEL